MNWNKRAEINEEINERYAEWEAKNISDWAKPIKGFALGWWNKQTLFTANEDMLRDEDFRVVVTYAYKISNSNKVPVAAIYIIKY